jgi:hypothetical protein
MSHERLVEHERRVVAALAKLVAQRALDVKAIDDAFRAADRSTTVDYQQALAQAAARLQAEEHAAEQALQTRRQSLTSAWESSFKSIEHESQNAIQNLVNRINRAERLAHKAMDEMRWLARTVYDAGKKREAQKVADLQQQLRSRMRTARSIEADAVAWLERVGHRSVVEATVIDVPTDVANEGIAERLLGAAEKTKNDLLRLRALPLPPFVRGAGLAWIFVALAAILAPALGWLTDWRPILWLPPTFVLTAAGGVALSLWLRKVARQQTSAIFQSLVKTLRLTEALCKAALAQAKAEHDQIVATLRRERDAEFRLAGEKHAPTLATCRTQREVDLVKLTHDADEKLIALKQQFDEDLRQATELAARLKKEARASHEQVLAAAHVEKERRIAENKTRHTRACQEGTQEWDVNYSRLQAELTAIRQEVLERCPPWDVLVSSDWRPPATVPSAIRFGQFKLDLRGQAAQTSPGESGDSAQDDDFVFDLPALLDFPAGSSVYIRSHGAGRQRAIELMQVVMLRLLTSLPPGKMRFTIIDPVGLGQNFASFMHLADHDEALVGHRIWTEPMQIEQRLTDLTEHIETVIQKYLRNEFPTIEAYNEEAGEVAEAFRTLVVANFPAGFTEAAARRLLAIAASGPRCGVHVLISVDAKLPALPGISLADLQKNAVVFVSNGEQLFWHDAEFKDLPLTADESPTDEFKRVLERVGSAAISAKRVEIPFEAIAPAADKYWTFDSRRGIDVPLGRAGATRLQHLRLGQGTSQHVLIAGKTGSGKSTLLHALVTNAALRYSPDELELYLIDFKKGVEFKTYVTHELPHARVIAIESEREFGLSVMQRLDTEMKLRGERFREVGVQDIGAYRDTGERLPRILFIVDEFQEFFVEDDKVGQEASLLLDRLVRQGRAFGIHVHLGSQTLGGAYTLARTTLGQMAVRIALQCSEADAHLILSEDNAAARLLSRPGEAIYNDANGLVEGNHPFQVVWLPDDRREVFLDSVSRLTIERPPALRRPQIVFEGTKPADMDKNETLAALFEPAGMAGTAAGSAVSAPGSGAGGGPRIWLGEPLAIEAATSADFPRRGGANLLMLGQNDEAAAGIMIAAIVSLAAQFPPTGSNGHPQAPQFVVLSGASGDREYTGLLRKLPAWLHDRVRLADVAETAATVAELAADVERRQTSPADRPRFFFVFDLSRLRELRRQEDDFSFSRDPRAARRPDQLFTDILREGPALGVHTIVWCDTYTSCQRALERQMLKEFETRVLLQMSAADSSLLIDTPAASTLGRHRALLHREDEGRLEKFRPFSPPSSQWLARACERLTGCPTAVTGPLSPAGDAAKGAASALE